MQQQIPQRLIFVLLQPEVLIGMLLLLLCMLLPQLGALSGMLLRSSDSAAATATWPSALGQAAACCQYERAKGASLLLLAQLCGLSPPQTWPSLVASARQLWIRITLHACTTKGQGLIL